MAITFSRINEYLQDRKQDLQPQQNAGQPTVNPEAPGFTMNTSSGFAGGNAGAKDTAGARLGPQINVAKAMTDINRAAVGDRAQAKVTQDIANAQAKLKQNAENYLQGARQFSEGFQLGDEDLQKLYAGDENAYNKVKDRLITRWNDNLMQKYQPDMKEIESLRMLADPEKRQAYNTQQRNLETGGKYTAGMSSFDEALNRQSNIDYSGLMNANKQLADEAKKYQQQAADVRAQEQAQFEAIAPELKNKINTYAQGEFSKGAKAQEAVNLAAYEADAQRKIAEAQASQANDLATLRQRVQIPDAVYELAKPDLDKLLADINAGKYVTELTKFSQPQEMVSQELADKLNRLAMLTQGQNVYASNTYKPEAQVSATNLQSVIDAIIADAQSKVKQKVATDEAAARDARIAADKAQWEQNFVNTNVDPGGLAQSVYTAGTTNAQLPTTVAVPSNINSEQGQTGVKAPSAINYLAKQIEANMMGGPKYIMNAANSGPMIGGGWTQQDGKVNVQGTAGQNIAQPNNTVANTLATSAQQTLADKAMNAPVPILGIPGVGPSANTVKRKLKSIFG